MKKMVSDCCGAEVAKIIIKGKLKYYCRKCHYKCTPVEEKEVEDEKKL